MARNVSNDARTAAEDLSLMMSTAPSADSLFQSWRSFLRVEPDRLTPNSLVTNGLAPVDNTSGTMPRADSVLSTAAWLGVSASNDIRFIVFGSRGFVSIAASSAGITSSTWAGSTTGLDRKA
ncbi:hypothetical protein UP10_01905 [Bradyrhizobium sp. LTSPM299]|nr:hypothetical protein UP10_01905 [Bradyrhizobium sp. LTSPM299]